MTFALPFLRLVATGSLYTVESFSWSLSLISDNGGGVAPSSVPAGVITAVSNFHASAFISSAAKLETIKLNLIGTDGKYADQDDTVLHDFATPVPGGNTGTTPAPQLALAVTLRTGAKRGPAHAGRFYIPTPVLAISADGRLSTTTLAPVVTAATTLLNALDDALPGWDPGVVSNIGTGRQKAVTHVEIGRVMDTIRSRRTSLPEEYVVGAPLAGDA